MYIWIMITLEEYTNILKRYGVKIKNEKGMIVIGEIEREMICSYSLAINEKSVLMWPDIGYECKFKAFATTCDLYEDVEKFEKAVKELVQKYKLMQIQQKMGKIEKDFT